MPVDESTVMPVDETTISPVDEPTIPELEVTEPVDWAAPEPLGAVEDRSTPEDENTAPPVDAPSTATKQAKSTIHVLSLFMPQRL